MTVDQTDITRGERSVIALVGAGHYASHVMQLALPVLFPILHDAFHVDFAALALIATLFFAASGLGQPIAGILVDRYGAVRLLMSGLTAMSMVIFLAGFVSSYWMFLPLAIVAGLGNSVFHPADLSILSRRVGEKRHGRAFAMHNMAGSLGYATSPVLVSSIAIYLDWRVALIAVGCGGILLAALLHWNRPLLRCDTPYERSPSSRGPNGALRFFTVVRSPFVLLGFAYFTLTSFAGSGVQAFGGAALNLGYGLALPAASLAISIYLAGSASGILVGGFLADWTTLHHRVAAIGLTITSVLMLVMSIVPDYPFGTISLLLFVAGTANGVTAPSRDILIRRSSAGSGMGAVFGFVYAGFDLGSATAPFLFGALLDSGAPHAVFFWVAVAFALAVPTVVQVQRRMAARIAAIRPVT